MSPADAATTLLASLGLRAAIGSEITTIRHAVTRFRITLTCFAAVYRGGRCSSRGVKPIVYRTAKWLTLPELASLPSSRPQRRLAAALGSSGPAASCLL
jgi:A/G-specific adenine glycosylase